jgi:hypothetical protein
MSDRRPHHDDRDRKRQKYDDRSRRDDRGDNRSGSVRQDDSRRRYDAPRSQSHQGYTPNGAYSSIPAESLRIVANVDAEYLSQIQLAKGDPGDLGSRINVISNYMHVDVPKNDFFNQYSVIITPINEDEEIGTSKYFYALLIYKLKMKQFPDLKYVFDGGDLFFTPIKFEDIDTEFQNFRVRITFRQQVSVSVLTSDVLQIFNLTFRHANKKLGYLNIGRFQYNLNGQKSVPNHPIVILPGFRTTVTPTKLGLLYNSDAIFKSLRTDTILDTYHRLKSKYRGRDADRFERKFMDEVCGQIVFLSYSKKTVRITGVA